jgi:hypothetical protein
MSYHIEINEYQRRLITWEWSGSTSNGDVLMRDNQTGTLRNYDVSGGQITGSEVLGVVGLDWKFSGILDDGAGGASLLLRNDQSGGLEEYALKDGKLVSSAYLGTIGTEWQLVGTGIWRGCRLEQEGDPVDARCNLFEQLHVAGFAAGGSHHRLSLPWTFPRQESVCGDHGRPHRAPASFVA